MTAEKKEKMIKDLEEKLGYSLRDIAELLQSLNEEDDKEVPQKPNPEQQLTLKVSSIIQEIGVPTNIKGYFYLRDAIILVYKDTNYIDAMTKKLYPEVARIYETTGSRVERSIRHSIEVAWNRGNIEILHKYFGYTVSARRGKPTNSECISLLADYIRLRDDK